MTNLLFGLDPESAAADAKIEKYRKATEKTRAAIAETNAKIAKAERELERLEHQAERAKQALSKQERKARTRRLIERGAIAEAFIPNAETLSNDEFKAALQKAFRATS
jgi:predicted  nucleic acid-binding Zn-ribbon protein